MTYAELQTALETWSHRDDLTGLWPEIIALAEGRLYDDLILKDMETEEDLSLTQSQNYVALPSGYLSPIALWLIVDGQRDWLHKRLPEQLPYDTQDSQPTEWAIDGENIRFDCPALEAYSAKFRMLKSSNLSDSNTTNYLLTRRPDVYLAACMVEYARYAEDVEAFNKWEPKYLSASAKLQNKEAKSREVLLRTDFGTRRPNIITGI